MSKQIQTFSAEDRHSIVQESLRDDYADISRKYMDYTFHALGFRPRGFQE